MHCTQLVGLSARHFATRIVSIAILVMFPLLGRACLRVAALGLVDLGLVVI